MEQMNIFWRNFLNIIYFMNNFSRSSLICHLSSRFISFSSPLLLFSLFSLVTCWLVQSQYFCLSVVSVSLPLSLLALRDQKVFNLVNKAPFQQETSDSQSPSSLVSCDGPPGLLSPLSHRPSQARNPDHKHAAENSFPSTPHFILTPINPFHISGVLEAEVVIVG